MQRQEQQRTPVVNRQQANRQQVREERRDDRQNWRVEKRENRREWRDERRENRKPNRVDRLEEYRAKMQGDTGRTARAADSRIDRSGKDRNRDSTTRWKSGDNKRWKDSDRRYDRDRRDDRKWRDRDHARDRDKWRDKRHRDYARWNHEWRRDKRYDWKRYRNSHRHVYRAPRYYVPYGWDYGYRRFSIGITLWSGLYGSRYWINDPWYYRLPPVHGPLRWVRYYDDALLVDTRTGYVVDVIHDFFW